MLLWLPLPIASWCATGDVATIAGLVATAEKWSGGVAVGTKVYGIPHDSKTGLIVDTLTNTVTRPPTFHPFTKRGLGKLAPCGNNVLDFITTVADETVSDNVETSRNMVSTAARVYLCRVFFW